MVNEKERINWIDYAKGLGIILVVLGHAYVPRDWAIIIYSFHMPLFFFLSGFLFSAKKHNTLKGFINTRSKSLLIPYFTFSLLSFIYLILINILASGQNSISKAFIGIFYANGIDGYMNHNTPLWFLACLIIVELIFFLIVSGMKSNLKIAVALIILSIIGFVDSLYMPFRLPWSIDIALTATVFFGFGYLFRKKNIVNILFKYKTLFLIAAIIGNSYFTVDMIKRNYMIDMNYNELNHYYDFYIPAICGIIIIVIISSLIKESKLLSFLGKNTLIILVAHVPMLTIFGKIFDLIGWDYGLGLRSIILTCITLVLLFPVIHIINRYFPFLLGKKSTKSYNKTSEVSQVN